MMAEITAITMIDSNIIEPRPFSVIDIPSVDIDFSENNFSLEHTFRHVTSRDAIGESEGYPNRVNSSGYFQNILLYQSCNRGYMKKLALSIALITTMVLS